MPQYEFGTGELWGVDDSVTPNVPVKFGALQGASVDFDFSTKELHSQYQFPVAVGRGIAKVSGKADFAQINANSFGRLFFNVAPATGTVQVVSGETATIPGTPYQVTVANGANFLQDLGVRFTATGLYLVPVTSGPATGQYSVSAAGGYTFAAADTTLGVTIDYTYNSASSGKKLALSNQLLGSAPQFQVILTQVFKSKRLTIKLNACMSSKLALATALEDFTIPSFDFTAFVDASNNLGQINVDEL